MSKQDISIGIVAQKATSDFVNKSVLSAGAIRRYATKLHQLADEISENSLVVLDAGLVLSDDGDVSESIFSALQAHARASAYLSLLNQS